jgi:hypothetical protein
MNIIEWSDEWMAAREQEANLNRTRAERFKAWSDEWMAADIAPFRASCRTTADGGVLIISTPLEGDLIISIRNGMLWLPDDAIYYLNLLEPTSWSSGNKPCTEENLEILTSRLITSISHYLARPSRD